MWLYLVLSVWTKKSKWLSSAQLENLTEKQLQMDGSIKRDKIGNCEHESQQLTPYESLYKMFECNVYFNLL